MENFVPRSYVQRLMQILIVSGAMNILLLTLFFYWMSVEKNPRTFCDVQPAEVERVAVNESKSRSGLVQSYRKLPFNHLLTLLQRQEYIDSKFRECDLALAILVSDHHFDLQRCLGKEVLILNKWWIKTDSNETIAIYPNLTESQVTKIVQFARTEKWPLTPEGLFLKMKESASSRDPSLVAAFCKAEEYVLVDRLFNRLEKTIEKQDLIQIILEGDWQLLSQFVREQKQAEDLSLARRQQFLLKYTEKGSGSALRLLLHIEHKAIAAEEIHQPTPVVATPVKPKPPKVQVVAETKPVNKASAVKISSQRDKLYVVKQGDSLGMIAKKYQTSVAQLMQSNKLATGSTLKPGKILVIP